MDEQVGSTQQWILAAVFVGGALLLALGDQRVVIPNEKLASEILRNDTLAEGAAPPERRARGRAAARLPAPVTRRRARAGAGPGAVARGPDV